MNVGLSIARQNHVALTSAVCLSLVAIVGFIDFVTPANVMVGLLQVIPIALALVTRNTKLVWVLTAAAIVCTWAAFVWGPPATQESVQHIALLNRAMLTVLLITVAAMVHLRVRALDLTDAQQAELERQYLEVENLNREISQREEEVSRQNEELQSQAEELERQTEELRVTNEELLGWQTMLEQLLELSRSMTAEMSRNDVYDRICQSLSTLSEGCPSAILERQGSELRIICHHNFGAAGLVADTLPIDRSFAGLLMSLGQTGYLEDTELRPEIVLPVVKQGPPFRSILAAPLRVRGQIVGTIELYSAEPRNWDEQHIAMIESLAFQTAVSMHNFDMVDSIRQERRRFEAAFRSVPFGVIVADDPDAKLVHVNPAAAALFNLPADENFSPHFATGARLRQQIFKAGQPVPPERLPLNRALHGEEIHAEELDLVLPGGITRTLLCSGAPVYNFHGGIAGAVVAFADVSLQKTLQREIEARRREAEESNVRKTRFLAAVSHDIRTPANAISLMAELIRHEVQDGKVDAQLATLAEQLQTNTRALIDLVGDVLDLARFDSGKSELIESEFSLHELIHDECRQMRPLAIEKQLTLSAEPAEQQIWVRTDRVKLARVLGNLIGNAIKFTSVGEVRVAARIDDPPQHSIVVEVHDTGIGIAPEHRSLVFDEFAQLFNPARDRSHGSGLGLAICKRLVELMGGAMELDSTLGEGSVFRIRLPIEMRALRLDATLRSHDHLRRQAVTAEPAQPIRLRVLLVEDHHDTRTGTERILTQKGLDVISAANGQQARAALAGGQYDVILLDMMLPDLDGRELLKELQAERPTGLRGILVLTGDLTTQRIDEIKQLGADGLIAKPIQVEKLLAALRNFADRLHET